MVDSTVHQWRHKYYFRFWQNITIYDACSKLFFINGWKIFKSLKIQLNKLFSLNYYFYFHRCPWFCPCFHHFVITSHFILLCFLGLLTWYYQSNPNQPKAPGPFRTLPNPPHPPDPLGLPDPHGPKTPFQSFIMLIATEALQCCPLLPPRRG